MASQRTGGMTAVGILNLILGALGTFIALMVVVVGGLFAAGGAALGSETAGAEAAAEMAFAGGGFLMLIGIAIQAFGTSPVLLWLFFLSGFVLWHVAVVCLLNKNRLLTKSEASA